MIYFLLFLLLLLLSILEYYSNSNKVRNKLFLFASFLVICFCCLRYGVGFDYFSYQTIFSSLPQDFSGGLSFEGIHGEPFFLGLFILFKFLGIEYEVTNSVITFIIVLLFIFFIRKYSVYKVFSLLILYCWFYVYIFSLLRQGLAMGLVLVAYPFMIEKKYIKYLIIILFASLFHSSAIIALAFPLIPKFQKYIKSFYFPILFLLIILLLLNISPLKTIMTMYW